MCVQFLCSHWTCGHLGCRPSFTRPDPLARGPMSGLFLHRLILRYCYTPILVWAVTNEKRLNPPYWVGGRAAPKVGRLLKMTTEDVSSHAEALLSLNKCSFPKGAAESAAPSVGRIGPHRLRAWARPDWPPKVHRTTSPGPWGLGPS